MKAGGGYRPIGGFCSPYWLWAKLRRPFVDDWERSHPSKHFASVAGKSPTVAVWRQSLRAELAAELGQSAGAFCHVGYEEALRALHAG